MSPVNTDAEELPAGDYVFMAFLTLGPMSAYDIKKIMAISVNFFWTAAHSQVYQQARRLLRQGFIEEGDAEGSRRRRMLSLTPKGRTATITWLAGSARPFRIYDESLVKLFFAGQVDRSATVAMLQDQQRHHEESLAQYVTMCAGAEDGPNAEPSYERLVLDLGGRVEQAYLAWIEGVLAALAPPSPPTRRRPTP